MLRQFIEDIKDDPWEFVKDAIAAVIMLGSIYLICLFVSALG